jgi:hypothetical protein
MKMFRIFYEVRDRKNQKLEQPPEEPVDELGNGWPKIETLSDAIDAYCPDAELAVHVGHRRIPLDICRDIYGFHENLLEVMYAVAFDQPCNDVGYPHVLASERTGQQNSYGIMLTEQQAPPLLVFLADSEQVYFQTRSLATKDFRPQADDIITPVVVPKRDVIVECTSFLRRYLDDLTSQMPEVKELADYQTYVQRINAMRARVGAADSRT